MGSFANLARVQDRAAIEAQLGAIRLTPAHPAFEIIHRLREIMPIEHVAVSGLDTGGHGVGTGTFLLSDFPESYLLDYYAGGYGDGDPLAALFRTGVEICGDSDAAALHESLIADLLLRHGITERTVVRVMRGGRTCGAVSVASSRPLSHGERSTLRQTAYILHAEAARPILNDMNRGLKLTKGELYCLERAAQGLTSEDIAAANTYSVETINTYLKSATRKLGASNRTQAVAEAIRRQLIA